jgi:hypothetical protein
MKMENDGSVAGSSQPPRRLPVGITGGTGVTPFSGSNRLQQKTTGYDNTTLLLMKSITIAF